MRKLRTFYWKVTEFLNDDKIACFQGLAAFAINDVYWRAEWCGYLCRRIDYLCKMNRLFILSRLVVNAILPV